MGLERWLCCVLAVLAALAAAAATLRPVGVIGNSGVEGKTLVRVSDNRGAEVGSGIVVDGNLSVWISAVDAVNQLTFDGKLIERHAIEPAGSRIDSPYFAAFDGVLYFFAHEPKPIVPEGTGSNDISLFALPMRRGAQAAPFLKTPEVAGWPAPVLCPAPVRGQVAFVVSGGNTVTLKFVDPKSAAVTSLVVPLLRGSVNALAYDAARDEYIIGGYFGRNNPCDLYSQQIYEFIHLDPTGTILDRGQVFPTEPAATVFAGVASIAGNALWATARYGYLGRKTLDGQAAPGKICSFDGRFCYATQITDVRASVSGLLPPKGMAGDLEPLLFSSFNPAESYLGVWNRGESTFTLTRHFGSLPKLTSLSMSPDGWLAAGSEFGDTTSVTSLFWWRWDDDPDAPPRFGNYLPPHTAGVFSGRQMTALRRNPWSPKANGEIVVYKPERSMWSSLSQGNLPFLSPAGLTELPDPKTGRPVLYATDAATKTLWRRPENGEWAKVDLGAVQLTAPGDLAVLPGNCLALADAGVVRCLVPAGDGFILAWTLSQWGDGPAQHFGPHIRLAADGNVLAVTDCERQRVLAFDAGSRALLAQLGETDVPGDDLQHLRAPDAIAIRGERIAVADVENQRVLKLVVEGAR